MSNLKDFKNKNTEFTGTTGIDLPEGTTAQRVDQAGRLRYNTETGLAEYYGENWKPIDSPPVLTGISPTSWASDGSTLATITLSGSNFSSSIQVKFIGADGTEYDGLSVNRISASSATATTTAAMGVSNEPYDVKVVNSSGLSSTLEDVLDAGALPAFVTAADLGTITVGSAMTAIEIEAYDPDSTAITNMTVTAGSLPAGTSGAFAWNGNRGVFTITGTPSAGATNTFTITATDGVNTNTREFTLVTAVADGSSESLAAASPAALTSAGVTTDGNRWIKPPGQTTAHQLYFEGTTGYVRLSPNPGYSYWYIGNTSGTGTDQGTSCGSASCVCTNLGSYTVGTLTLAFFDACDTAPYCNYTFLYKDAVNSTTINNAWLNALEGTLATGYKGSDFYLYHNDMEGSDNVGFNFSDGTQPVFTMSDNHSSPNCTIAASDYVGTINSLVGSGAGTKLLTGMHYRGGSDPGAYIFTLRNNGIMVK